MKIILIIILSIFYYTTLVMTQDGGVDPVICVIVGEIWMSTKLLKISDFPEGCNIFTVGQFAFDRGDGTYVMKEDEDIMKQLKDAQKNVYLTIGFIYGSNWVSIFDPKNIDQFNNQSYKPLVQYLNDNKINGLIINCEDIYLPVKDIDQKINNFITMIKKDVQLLKVGLIITGRIYKSFQKKELFDFTITNPALDAYIIDMSNLNICDFEAKRDGLIPTTTTSPNMTSIELVTNAVTASTMDKSKLYASIQVSVIIPENLVPERCKLAATYAEYCKKDDPSTSKWCSNPSKLSYDQGAYVKKFYKGLLIPYLDLDDAESKCNCSKFPVSKQVIEGWKSNSLTACPALDI